MIAENTRKFAGGTAPTTRYIDLIEHKEPVAEKKPVEIIADLNKKCGLTMIEDGETTDEC